MKAVKFVTIDGVMKATLEDVFEKETAEQKKEEYWMDKFGERCKCSSCCSEIEHDEVAYCGKCMDFSEHELDVAFDRINHLESVLIEVERIIKDAL